MTKMCKHDAVEQYVDIGAVAETVQSCRWLLTRWMICKVAL